MPNLPGPNKSAACGAWRDHNGQPAHRDCTGAVSLPAPLDRCACECHDEARTEPLSAQHEGAVVAIYSEGHGPRLGIVSNIPPRRTVGRVYSVLSGGLRLDANGARLVLTEGQPVAVLEAHASAGWANRYEEA